MANTPAFDLDAFGNTPMNCMTLIAGKAASATGHVLVGHNEDDGGHVVVRHGWVPPRDWEKGAVMPAEEGCALLPQVAHTLGYYWVEYRKDVMGLSNADGFVNERGVVIVSNSMGTSREGMENADCVKDGGIAFNLRRALADDVRIVQLRRAVREAAESKLRNGVIDTNDLLRKITEEATAATARSAREIELVKTIYELKHTINR